ncbi:unnamed protein product [Calicophoron daubneyi]|uniref:Cadherin domain-containing protein n=1 Tax=Calicophoron daubneyi TaxID=300641 RepID=A0AAV2TIC5_CALDB
MSFTSVPSKRSGSYFSVQLFMYTFQMILSSQGIPSHILRIREGVPAGTVLIPDLLTFLQGQAQGPVVNYGTSSKSDGETLLAIGNAVMPGANWFTVSQHSRSLIVKTPPDRDALCPTKFKMPETAIAIDRGGVEFQDFSFSPELKNGNGADCVLELSIIHGSPTNPSFDTISVILEDVNDHAPSFSKTRLSEDDSDEFVITVEETVSPTASNKGMVSELQSSQNFQKIPLPLATDPDYGLNGIRGYRLEGQDSYLFRLEVGLPAETSQTQEYDFGYDKSAMYTRTKSSQLWLVPADSVNGGRNPFPGGGLDREYRSEYHLVLVAFDGGTPQRTGRLPIRLVVKDVNDHAPQFDQTMYSGQISENDPPGHTVFEFSAQDEDCDVGNARISFRIPGERRSKIHHSLGPTDNTIDQMTSEMAALSDAQLAAAQLFAVEQVTKGYEDGSSILSSGRKNATYGRLIIRHQTKESLRKAAAYAISVARRQDPSAKTGSHSSYPLPGLNYAGNQDNSVKLEFLIEAMDHGHPKQLSSRVPASIQITDVNDHPPKIFVSYLKQSSRSGGGLVSTARQSWGQVTENLGRAMVAQITVTDEDAIFAETDIMCNTNDSRFTLEEIGSGGGIGADLNNVWLKSGSSLFHDSEKSAANALPSMQRSRRAIVPTKAYKLMCNTPLDRESGTSRPNVVEFALTCADNALNHLPGGQLTTQVLIQIMIEDANDNNPVFDQLHYAFHVPENHPALTSSSSSNIEGADRFYVGQVRANDADEGLNAAIEYRLASNPSSSMELDQVTGKLYVIRPFDRESVTDVAFQVLAIDCRQDNRSESSSFKTNVRRTGTADVRLIVDDVNDSPPVFQEMNYHFEVEEGLDLIRVGQVWATDADQGEAARVSYRLAVGPNFRYKEFTPSPLSMNQIGSNPNHLYDEALEVTTHFQIDPTNGMIHLKGRLDRERRAHYEFIVLAVDNPRALPAKYDRTASGKQGEVVQFTATATVLITVLDVNDNPPQIISPRNHVEFTLSPDLLIAGNTVFTIRATDPDLGENGTIEYALLQVEDDVGIWAKMDETVSNTGVNSSDSIQYQSNETKKGKNRTRNSVDSFPFAVDRTAGICYLRENLPPLDVEGPHAYQLRIRAYDLGRLQSLNSSLVVRVVRQPYESRNGLMPGSHAQGKGNAMLSNSNMDEESSLRFTSGDGALIDGKTGTWTGGGQARISDRTMVVILSTVFILLLLTTIVLLLLVRYRRLFLRNIAFPNGHANGSPIDKPNIGYAAAKPFNAHSSPSGANGLFSEVVSAPWVNTSSSPVDSPESFSYPTIYNAAVSQNLSPSRVCFKAPAVCWSPQGTLCKSPMFHQVLRNDGSLFRTPPAQTRGSAAYTLGMRPNAHNIQITSKAKQQLFASPMCVGMQRNFVLENTALRDEADEDYRTINLETRVNNLRELGPHISSATLNRPNGLTALNSSLLLSNSWARVTPVQTPTNINRNSMLRRSAISLENLSGNVDTSVSKDYSQLVHFAASPVLVRDGRPSRDTDTVSYRTNEYQSLSHFTDETKPPTSVGFERPDVQRVNTTSLLTQARGGSGQGGVMSSPRRAPFAFEPEGTRATKSNGSGLQSDFLTSDSLCSADPFFPTFVEKRSPAKAAGTPNPNRTKQQTKGRKHSILKFSRNEPKQNLVTFDNPLSHDKNLLGDSVTRSHQSEEGFELLQSFQRSANSPKKSTLPSNGEDHAEDEKSPSHQSKANLAGSFV